MKKIRLPKNLENFLTSNEKDSLDRQRYRMQKRLESIHELLQTEATVATEPQFPKMAASSPSFVSQTAFPRVPHVPSSSTSAIAYPMTANMTHQDQSDSTIPRCVVHFKNFALDLLKNTDPIMFPCASPLSKACTMHIKKLTGLHLPAEAISKMDIIGYLNMSYLMDAAQHNQDFHLTCVKKGPSNRITSISNLGLCSPAMKIDTNGCGIA